MLRVSLAAVIVLGACVDVADRRLDDVPSARAGDPGLCNPDEDPNCPDPWAQIRQVMLSYAQSVADSHGLVVLDRSDGGCGRGASGVSYCTSVWQLTGSHWLETTCTQQQYHNTRCSSWLCHGTDDGESCSILTPGPSVAAMASHQSDPDLCTLEDQEAGICQPSPWSALQQHTANYATSIGLDPTADVATWGFCGGTACFLRVELPTVVIVAACEARPGGTVCGSNTCQPGTQCTVNLPPTQPAFSADSDYCTPEDAESGICGDTGGGQSPATLDQTTEEYATTVIGQHLANHPSDQVVYVTGAACATSGGYNVCNVHIELVSMTVDVSCTRYPDGHQTCETTVV